MNSVHQFSGKSIKGFKVAVGNKLPKEGKDLDSQKYKRCGQYNRKLGNAKRVTLKCKKPVSGKFLFVYLPRKGVLKICKLKAYKRKDKPVIEPKPPVTPVIEPPPVKPPVIKPTAKPPVQPSATPVIEPPPVEPPVIKPPVEPPVQPPVKPGEPGGNFSTKLWIYCHFLQLIHDLVALGMLISLGAVSLLSISHLPQKSHHVIHLAIWCDLAFMHLVFYVKEGKPVRGVVCVTLQSLKRRMRQRISLVSPVPMVVRATQMMSLIQKRSLRKMTVTALCLKMKNSHGWLLIWARRPKLGEFESGLPPTMVCLSQ